MCLKPPQTLTWLSATLLSLTLGLAGCIDPDAPDLCAEGCGPGQDGPDAMESRPDFASGGAGGASDLGPVPDADPTDQGPRPDAMPDPDQGIPMMDAGLEPDAMPEPDGGSPDAGGPHPFPSGSGTFEDPWPISTPEQLRAMERFPYGAFVLTRDLDLGGGQGQLWEPLFSCPPEVPRCETPFAAFSGYFDGQGHTIRGMRIVSQSDYVGFMGLISGGWVFHIRFEDCHVQGSTGVGLVAGAVGQGLSGYGVVAEIVATNNEVAGLDGVGGLIGQVVQDGLTLSDSEFNGAVGGVNQVGGLVGRLEGRILRVDFDGSIEGVGADIGGLVGLQGPGSEVGNATASSVIGIHGNARVGGVTGSCVGGALNDVANEGEARGQNTIGGIVGRVSEGCRITRVAHLGLVVALDDIAGGLIGRLDGGLVADGLALAPVVGPEGSTLGATIGQFDQGGLANLRYDGELTGLEICTGNGPQPEGMCTREHIGSFASRFWYDPANPLLEPFVAADTWDFFEDRFLLPRTTSERRELEPLPR